VVDFLDLHELSPVDESSPGAVPGTLPASQRKAAGERHRYYKTGRFIMQTVFHDAFIG
jgi:hypothetical protein